MHAVSAKLYTFAVCSEGSEQVPDLEFMFVGAG